MPTVCVLLVLVSSGQTKSWIILRSKLLLQKFLHAKNLPITYSAPFKHLLQQVTTVYPEDWVAQQLQIMDSADNPLISWKLTTTKTYNSLQVVIKWKYKAITIYH